LSSFFPLCAYADSPLLGHHVFPLDTIFLGIFWPPGPTQVSSSFILLSQSLSPFFHSTCIVPPPIICAVNPFLSIAGVPPSVISYHHLVQHPQLLGTFARTNHHFLLLLHFSFRLSFLSLPPYRLNPVSPLSLIGRVELCHTFSPLFFSYFPKQPCYFGFLAFHGCSFLPVSVLGSPLFVFTRQVVSPRCPI